MKYTDFSFISKSAVRRLERAFQQSGLLNVALSYETVHQGVILPFLIGGRFDAMGGVERADGSFVKSSVFDWRMHGDYKHNHPLESDCKVIFIASIHKCWGHVITDAIKRLWILNTEEYKNLKAAGYKLAYISYPDIRGREFAYIHRVLQLCGIDISEMIYVASPTRFKEVIVPDSCYIQYHDFDCCTKEFVDIIERMKSKIVINQAFPTAEKIYLTRTRYNSKKDYGEEHVESLFRDKGYTVVSPENLCVDSQIYLISNAKFIASTEGSISHSMIFADKDCECTVLRKADYLNKYQILIANVFLERFKYIDANLSVYTTHKHKEDGPFCLYITKNLLRYLHSDLRHTHPILSKTFWRYLIKHNPLMLHLRNFRTFVFAPMTVKRVIIKNKLHFIKYR